MLGTLFHSLLLSLTCLICFCFFISQSGDMSSCIWRWITAECCSISKGMLLYMTTRFMAPLRCLTTSPPPPLFSWEGWWRIDVLVNINTALASITKPSAINTEEWSQLGIRFNGGHQAPPHPSSLCVENEFQILLLSHSCLSLFVSLA